MFVDKLLYKFNCLYVHGTTKHYFWLYSVKVAKIIILGNIFNSSLNWYMIFLHFVLFELKNVSVYSVRVAYLHKVRFSV